MIATIQETIEALQRTLVGYVEATYHVADPSVVRQRRHLLEEIGGIFQNPFLESTPRYQTGQRYAEMTNLPNGARDLYMRLSNPSAGKPLLFDPPYTHQAEAIEGILVERRNLMIMTGTGSGKTESFLLPVIGKLAVEAHDKPEQFAEHHAVRAMVLYPMNALVNDQLGRLRLLFGDPRAVGAFEQWSGRAALFARYTSRTPYAGVRTRQKDSRRLKSIGDFFVDIEDAAAQVSPGTPQQSAPIKAQDLQARLHEKGKWPAKPSVGGWFGSGNWLDSNGEFRRAITRAGEAELLTRYEVQVSPPDLLITNYSMLEYMMLRPIERPIFDKTRAWLKACPDEKFLIVLDEAHLYRGAQGAEVGLLLRRLRERLGIPAERFQVICATASFSAEGKKTAGVFGGQLTGADPSSFRPITGDLKLQPGEGDGVEADAKALCSVDMAKFYADLEATRDQSVESFTAYRGQPIGAGHGPDIHAALSGWAPFSRLVNATMVGALSFDEVRERVFPKVDATRGNQAINTLLALGSRARLKPDDASLLPCRIHAFYRGLPGLWACTDPHCEDLPAPDRGGPIGRLYSQPRARCACNAPVLEYFTCRYCGTSYARAYTKDVRQPRQIFGDAGHHMFTADGFVEALEPLDLLLEAPATATLGIPAVYDLVTGRLDPPYPSERTRIVYLAPSTIVMAGQADSGDDDDDDEVDGDGSSVGAGQFAPCGCCKKYARGNKSSVQDHVTKGDQPFQALLSSQIRVQPPSPKPATEFAPLRGRKVLVFSDSRQVAARLAPTLQNFSFKDTIRALLPRGYRMLEAGLPAVVLDNAYMAVIVAAHRFGVRLRPGLETSEVMPTLHDTPPGSLPDAQELMALINEKPPVNLTRAIADALRDNVLGFEALAVASIREAPKHTDKLLATLPNLSGLAETPETKLAVVRAWLRAWARKPGIWFKDMPPGWWGTGGLVRAHRGEFKPLDSVFSTPALKSAFKKGWLPILLPLLTENINGQHRMVARNLTLEIGGTWRRCNRCTSVHRPISTLGVCIDCSSDDIRAFDPDADDVFQARKGFYRAPVIDALTSDQPALMSLIAAEHTAQLNAARPDEAFSRAEHHEMRFQDIDLAWRNTDVPETAIDVLSSTTTMEVGIDIGELSGVALRNMPPGRANYQQRAGRAGRRGNAVATVVAFGSADSHDDHYFTRPQEMIRGDVIDPRLTLENPDIARRHIRAFVLQCYHEARLPDLDHTTEAAANLFSVLGKVGDFRDSTGILNRVDLAEWLDLARDDLVTALQRWLPTELSPNDRAALIAEFVPDLLTAVDEAIGGQPPMPVAVETDDQPDMLDGPEAIGPADTPSGGAETEGAEQDPQPRAEDLVDVASDNLLDRLLYWGVLPRYAFPTDVAPFYVFSPNSTGFRHEMEFAPSQGLNVALSQYAPNKQIWIAGKQYTSRAIYSPFPNDRKNAWGRRKLYYECAQCGHAKTIDFDPARRGETLTCEACQTPGTFGPSKPWFRPPGFAHLWDQPAVTTPDEPNETAYATRAKLVMSTGVQDFDHEINTRLQGLATRKHLLVSNSGPGGDGYEYCVRCGRIESVASPEVNLRQPHGLPFPNENEPNCPGAVSRGVVLGVEFVTDIALFSFSLAAPIRLPPPNAETASAMRTICEAIAKAASQLLEIEPGEILAEHRPALNDDGAAGTVLEVFIYDTLAGGAGFSSQMASRGSELFCKALEVMENCPASCDASCYRCLRSFRNRLDHNLLDRKLGAQVLRQVLTGVTPAYSPERAQSSTELLAADLRRQLSDDFDVVLTTGSAAQAPISLTRKSTGKVTAVDLHSPVAPNVPLHAVQVNGLFLIDEMLVRKNLGEAVAKITDVL